MSGSNGRGGQPAKVLIVTQGGWANDLEKTETEFRRKVANLTIEALQSVNAPKSVFPQALRIMQHYMRAIKIPDSPRVNSNKARKEAQGIARFGGDLSRRAEKLAGQLFEAMNDERLKHLDSMIPDHSLSSHVAAAYDSLTAIADLIALADEGVTPKPKAQIRHEAGSKLKALARQNGIPMMEFVAAFKIHNPNSIEAFIKWYQRLDG